MGSFRWYGNNPSYPVVCRSPVLRPAVQCGRRFDPSDVLEMSACLQVLGS